jgi:hypothetical protein
VTPTEAAALLTVAAAFDNRKPDADAAKAWSIALGDLPFFDCRDAVVAHYRKTDDWLEDAPALTPPPGLDPIETIEWLKGARARIAAGETVDCDAAYGELKQRYLPELRALMPKPEEAS